MGFYLFFSYLLSGLAEIPYKKAELNAFCELCEDRLREGQTFLTSVSKMKKNVVRNSAYCVAD
jgi:hypothetical protein